MIYDPVREQLLVFGGYDDADPSYALVNDVRAWSLSGAPGWVRINPIGTPPEARIEHTAIYDPVRDRMIVFGGQTSSGIGNDVWVLNLSGTPTWTQLAPSGTPPEARYGHTAIYDATRDRMVVFGGFDGFTRRNDVWTLSFSGTPTWTQLTPTGTPPGGRESSTAIYDAPRDRMVLFGGADDSFVGQNDTWTLALSGSGTWSQLAPNGTPPFPRYGHVAVFDSPRNRMVVFGGFAATDTGFNEVADSYALNLSGNLKWTQLTPSSSPPAAEYPAAIYDPVRQQMVVYGGYNASAPVTPEDETWGLSLSGGSVAWTFLGPVKSFPDPLQEHSAIYDIPRNRAIVFGGFLGSGFSNATWTLSLNATPAWSPLDPTGTPPATRAYHTAIFDRPRNRMIVFGGATDSGLLNDLWSLSLTGTPAWTQLVPTGTPPAPRVDHSAIYDPVRDRMLVFGGYNGGPEFSDVWALSLSGTPVWTQLTPVGTAPWGRWGHTAVYDSTHDRMVVFGGFANFGSVSTPTNEVWALSLAGVPSWSQLTPTGTPPGARYNPIAVYDGARHRMLMTSGDGNDYNDAWTLTLDSPAWQMVSALPPPILPKPAGIFDLSERFVMIGGGNSNGARALTLPTNQAALNVGISPAGAGTVARDPSSTCYPVNSAVTLTAMPATGYAFSNWSGDVSGSSNPLTLTMSGDKSITANFIGYPVVVNVAPPSSGTVTKNPDQPTYAPGSTVTLTATPAAGYAFNGWSGDASGSMNPLTITVDGPKNITANFLGYLLVVTVAPPSSGTVTKDANQAVYAPGSTVTLTATPGTGYIFNGWSGDASGSTNPITITMDGPKSVTANFLGYALTLNVTPPGGGSIVRQPNQAHYVPGTAVTLTAAPAGGYAFSSWSGDVSGASNPITITMDGPRSVTANFVLPPSACGYWAFVQNGPDPPGREAMGTEYDPIRHRMLMFGGYGGSFLNELWELSFATDTWTQLAPTGGPPTVRDYPALLYEPVRDRMLLLGGNIGGGNSGFLNDVWALSLSGTPAWTQLTTLLTPPARFEPSIVYDSARDRLLMFGGYVSSPVNELWELRLGSLPLTWHQLAPTGTAPSGRYGSSAIYDPAGDRVIVYGGRTATASALTETWQLSLASGPAWMPLQPPGAVHPGGYGPVAAFEPSRQRILFFAGFNPAGQLTKDTSILSLAYGTSWSTVPPFGSIPGARSAAGGVLDTEHDRLVAFGGTDDNIASHFIDNTESLPLGLGGYTLDIAIDQPSRGIVRIDPAVGCFSPGQTVTLTARGMVNNVFVQWHGDATGSTNPLTITMDGNKSIVAEFASGATAVPETPVEFGLSPIAPNPALDEARIDFTLASEAHVELSVHDVAGREVARLVDEVRPAGRYSATWPGWQARTRPAAGIYFVRYEAGGKTVVRRLAMLP